MKIVECKKKNIFNIGFIDPDKVHSKTLGWNPADTAENILLFLTKQHYCEHILFPYCYE